MEFVEVSIDEVVLAYERWLEVCPARSRPDTYEGFNVFCQLTDVGFVKRTAVGYFVTNNVAERIRLLTGPHWYAILKAYNAIKEEHYAPAPKA